MLFPTSHHSGVQHLLVLTRPTCGTQQFTKLNIMDDVKIPLLLPSALGWFMNVRKKESLADVLVSGTSRGRPKRLYNMQVSKRHSYHCNPAGPTLRTQRFQLMSLDNLFESHSRHANSFTQDVLRIIGLQNPRWHQHASALSSD